MKKLPRLLVNTALAFSSVAATLLLLEVGVRAVTAFDRNYLDEIVNSRTADESRELTLADLIRRSDDDLIVYELRPGMRGRFIGHPLSINSLGMRDKVRSAEKPPGVFRIVGLGDSHMFGWGVAREETFLANLEKMLNERHPERRFEVLNLGVPGYNTVQEVQDFSRRADELSPDMVIINYVDNDMDLPNFLGRRPDLRTLRKSYLRELVRRRLSLLRGSPLMPFLLDGVQPEERTMRFRMPEEKIPERYRPLYGRENMIAAYRRLARLARDREIPYVILFNMDYYGFRMRGRTTNILHWQARDLGEICEADGYLYVDPQDRILRYLTENSLGSTDLWISESDSHSNPLRHRFVAEELFDRITEAGLIPTGR